MELFQCTGKWNVLSTLGLLEHTLILCNILLTLCAFHKSFPLEGGKRKLDQGLGFFFLILGINTMKEIKETLTNKILPDNVHAVYQTHRVLFTETQEGLSMK